MVFVLVFMANGVCCITRRVGWADVFVFAGMVFWDDEEGSSVLRFDCGNEVRLRLAFPLLLLLLLLL